MRATRNKEKNERGRLIYILGDIYMQHPSLMCLKDASKYLFVTPQAISHAYRAKKLPVIMKRCHPYFKQEDLDEYKKNKWSRQRFYNQKYMSVKEAANAIKEYSGKIYYYLRKGRIEHTRRGAAYLIDREKFSEKFLHTENNTCVKNDT